jgi:hypothetical protein
MGSSSCYQVRRIFPYLHQRLTAASISLEGQVITFLLDALKAMDPLARLKRAKHITAHTSFESGICVGRMFVCVVKTSPLSHMIKIFEPIDQYVRGHNKPTFHKLLQGGNDSEDMQGISHSSAVQLDHFLPPKLCVACVNGGFETRDPHTPDAQGLPDPRDEPLDFVRRRVDNTRAKPVAIYLIENEFLLCCDRAYIAHERGTAADLAFTELAFILTVVREYHGRTWCTGKEHR